METYWTTSRLQYDTVPIMNLVLINRAEEDHMYGAVNSNISSAITCRLSKHKEPLQNPCPGVKPSTNARPWSIAD